MKKTLCVLLICTLFAIQPATQTMASGVNNNDTPYISYVYDLNDDPNEIPAPYIPSQTLTGNDLGIGAMVDLSDIYYDEAGKLFYLCDSGNKRIVVLDTNFNLVNVIDSYTVQGAAQTFSEPTSAFVEAGAVYITDSAAGCIVSLDSTNYQLIKVYTRPAIKILGDDYTYEPDKIAVDGAGNMYVIASGINKGLIQLNKNGDFMGFLGAPKVTSNFVDTIIKKYFYTKEQRRRVTQNVPTEFNSIAVDSEGFLFVTSSSTSIRPISLLNSQGDNILKGYPDGDSGYSEADNSSFIDVTDGGQATYFAIDSTSCRIFAYDDDGNQLYTFGGKGSQDGTFRSPSALEIFDDKVIVTDRVKGNITVFSITEFGKSINNALNLYSQGYYSQAKEEWFNVLDTCSNYYIAAIDIAKIDIQNGNYSSAMIRLKSQGETVYYSKAFKYYRDNLLKNNFILILIGLIILIAILVLGKKILKKSKIVYRIKSNPVFRQFKYGNYVMFHPFDGFYDLKHEKRGSIKAALLIFGCFALFYTISVQYTGYIITETDPADIKVLPSVLAIILALLLWCIANWCVTTFLDGEGGFKDIFIATAYSLKPYVLFSMPILMISLFVSSEEKVFYIVLNTIMIIWVIALLLFGMMTTQGYSMTKAIIATILTIVGMALIVFIALLFLNLSQEVINYFTDLYKEVALRAS